MSRTHAATLVTLVLVVAWFLALGPAPIGGPATYVVVDGTSMEPTLVTGDLAVVRRSDSYGSGDIIAFRPRDAEPTSHGLVIHRIVGGSADEGFLTRGDNRTSEDPWRTRPAEIVGSVWFSVPQVGGYLARLRDPLVIAPLAAGITVFLVLLGGGQGGGREPDPEPQLLRMSRIDRHRRRLERIER